MSNWRFRLSPDWLAVDLRALAILRISLALLAGAELLGSLRDLDAFYSDAGILPRQDLILPWASRIFSAFMGSGGTGLHILWIGLGLVCALCLLVGRHSRVAGFWLWYLLASLHLRNPMVADRGAMLLELMLFWSLFVPLEARWSLAQRNRPDWLRLPDRWRGPGSVALLGQFSMIYLFSAALKNGPAWVQSFQAVQIACRSGQVATAYSEWLAGFSQPLRLATPAVIVLEAVLGLLIVNPLGAARSRLVATVLLLLFHVHNGLLFQLGFFPWMNALLSLTLLPTPWWDRLSGSRPAAEPGPSEALPPGYRSGRLGTAWLALCLATCVYINLRSIPNPERARLPEPVRSFARLLRLEQHWALFSPNPPIDLWFRLVARDASGKELDIWRPRRPLALERPPAPMTDVPSHAWQMALLNSVYKRDPNLRRRIGDYWSRHYRESYPEVRCQLLYRDYDPSGKPLPIQVRTYETSAP